MTGQSNPYRLFVQKYSDVVREASGYRLGGLAQAQLPSIATTDRTVMLFSPHPDDEGLVGALPYRLLREAHMRIVNVPVTFGSNPARVAERARELEAACRYLGFQLLQLGDPGFSHITPTGKAEKPVNWGAAVAGIARAVEAERPRIVLVPHRQEHNPTHQGTSELVTDSLARLDRSYSCYFVEWEYWTPLDRPNLLLEVSPDDLAILIASVSFHAGEVRRNPQHVNMPAWMQDNVRRGSELVGAPGGVAPDFTFATIYRVRAWKDGELTDCWSSGRFVESAQDLTTVFPEAFR